METTLTTVSEVLQQLKDKGYTADLTSLTIAWFARAAGWNFIRKNFW